MGSVWEPLILIYLWIFPIACLPHPEWFQDILKSYKNPLPFSFSCSFTFVFTLEWRKHRKVLLSSIIRKLFSGVLFLMFGYLSHFFNEVSVKWIWIIPRRNKVLLYFGSEWNSYVKEILLSLKKSSWKYNFFPPKSKYLLWR